MSFLWLFSRVSLVISGLASLAGVIQVVLIFSLISERQVRIPQGSAGIPLFILSHFRFFVLLTLVLDLAGFVASIALIRGKRWGQLTWAILLAVGIAWSLACVASAVFFPYPPPDTVSTYMTSLSAGFVTVLGLLGATLAGYLLKRLLSADTTRQLTPR